MGYTVFVEIFVPSIASRLLLLKKKKHFFQEQITNVFLLYYFILYHVKPLRMIVRDFLCSLNSSSINIDEMASIRYLPFSEIVWGPIIL